ncbi:MFS transporter [Hoyosella altamirensis]|uniref:Putative MFS transporter n=1 Tax=Hoyosella altamirensis TaxID=616997 RepID=A0A839RJS9_9ACTN|nr:MFS transporter [Hoyosella altamirensis]MBB3036488.1 putative MFS transporter [Hoyosella altamirensis]
MAAPGREDALIARLDRIPVWPYGNRLLIVIGAGYFFAYFDVVTIGLALPVISEQFGVSSRVAALAVTSSLIGYILGAFIDSRIADTRGRRASMMISVCLFTFGTLAAAASPGIAWLIAFRFIAGMGIGAEIAAVTTYVGELAPEKLRGRVTCIVGVMAFAGFALVPVIGRFLIPAFDAGWRVLFVIGAAGGLTIAVLRREMPASARWLLVRGRVDEAEHAIARAEERARAVTGRDLPEPLPAPVVQKERAGLLRPPYVWLMVLFTVIWTVYYIGNYGWLTLAPTLLTNHGFSLTSSLTFLIVTGTGFVAGALLATGLADRFDRRMTTAVGAAAWAAALLAIGLIHGAASVMFFGFVASATIGFLIPLLYTYTAEQFPPQFRATGVAVTDGVGHLGGAAAPLVVLTASELWGFTGAFIVMAATGVVTAVLLLVVSSWRRERQMAVRPT